jgi:hypothetical protein
MILVKSLIVIFLALLFANYYERILNFFVKLFDIRENFESGHLEVSGHSEAEEEKEEVYEEVTYLPPSELDNHAKISMDAKMMNELQGQIDELVKLSENATLINNNLKNNKSD